jgi:alcohol dehydrogenase
VRAIAQDRYGGVDVLALRELPEPRCAPNELVVEVRAAALNPSDWNIRQGRARALVTYRFPLVLGSDFSGRVCEVGAAVSEWQVGDEVFGVADSRHLGAFAERIAVEAQLVARKPAELTDVEAAALPVVAQTAMRGLFEELRIERGERVMILGASGGVGSVAVQLARSAGARVIATAGTRNRERVAALGAELVLDYRDRERFAKAPRVDAIFDTVGAPERIRAFRALRPGGRLVSIAGIPTAAAGAQHGVGVAGRALFELLSLRERVAALRRHASYGYFFVAANGERMRRVAAACSAQNLRAPIDRVFPIAEFREAFARLERGHPNGKVVLSRDAR